MILIAAHMMNPCVCVCVLPRDLQKIADKNNDRDSREISSHSHCPRQELAKGVPGTRAEEAYAIALTCKARRGLKRHLILQL